MNAHHEVDADHQQALHANAVALAQRVEQFAAAVGFVGLQPLLELVDDHEQLAFEGDAAAAANPGHQLRQVGAWATHRGTDS